MSGGLHDPDPHAWVSRVLAQSDVGPMPADVAARLEQRLARFVAEQAAATGGTVSGAAADVPATGADPFPSQVSAGHLAEHSRHGGERSAVPVQPTVPAAAPSRRSSGPGGREGVTASAAGAGGARRGRRQEEASDRRRLLLGRVLPVAAGVAVVAAVGGLTATLLTRGDGSAAVDASAEDPAAPRAAASDAPVPLGLVASGTAYSAAELDAQVPALVDSVASRSAGGAGTAGGTAEEAGEAAGVGEAAEDETFGDDTLTDTDTDTEDAGSQAAVGGAEEAAPLEAPQPGGAAVAESRLASPQAYAACASTVTGGLSDTAVAIDLATFDGLDAAVVVVESVDGRSYDVYVTSRDCAPEGLRDFYSVPVG